MEVNFYYLLCFDYLYFHFPVVEFWKLTYTERQMKKTQFFFFFSSEWMNLKINIQKLGVSPVLTLQVYMLDIFGCLNVPAGGKKQAVLEHGLF